MATLRLTGKLPTLANDQLYLEIAADNYQQLLNALKKQYPELAEQVANMALSIDGQIYQNPFVEAISDCSDIVFIPPIAAG